MRTSNASASNAERISLTVIPSCRKTTGIASSDCLRRFSTYRKYVVLLRMCVVLPTEERESLKA